jgi:hypothetical protein
MLSRLLFAGFRRTRLFPNQMQGKASWQSYLMPKLRIGDNGGNVYLHEAPEQ